MSQSDPLGSIGGLWGGERREPGSRRRKVYGYLKAANELRQSYSAQYSQRRDDEDDQGVPGAFPDVEIVRSVDEEMVIFPSYGRHHIKKQPKSSGRKQMPGTQDIRSPESLEDADYWKREWEKYEDDNAVVDVDVRGWVYSPNRGPLSRKNRLLVAVARRLSGIPAPAPSEGNSRASSRASAHRERLDDRMSRHEEEAAAKQAESLAQRGEAEADAAWRGGYSEDPNQDSDRASVYSSRSASPDLHKEPIPGHIPHPLTNSSLASDSGNSLKKRVSWTQPENMSKEELLTANAHLMARLKPFMSIPLTSTPITVFFFNDRQSQSRTVNTDDSGHFTVRASLDFLPTQVRVLASEKLSATEEVRITDANGVSLISDIDDTIKHSGISNGAKEIFRNTFIRELGDLVVEGVREWYSKMASMGVQMHYVSNSPWQLYPLLQSYFNLAGLPPGSFHLKQYSGMLQGIFEPAAERKKGSLEKILRDFPKRKFILVGDSGEADLEVYTDIVVANPGRVLGVFIRDVTTQEKKKFFDRSATHVDSKQSSRSGSEAPSDKSKPTDTAEERPSLPARRQLDRTKSEAVKTGPQMGTLIDLDDEPSPKDNPKAASTTDLLELDDRNTKATNGRSPPPARPNKPLALRAASNEHPNPAPTVTRKLAPPPPSKPRRLSNQTDPAQSAPPPRPPPSRAPFSSTKQNQGPEPKPTPTPEEQTYTAAVRNKVASAYNSIPSTRGYWTGEPGATSLENSQDPHLSTKPNPPPPPPRRTLTSYPAAAAQYASNRLSWGQAPGNEANASTVSLGGNAYGSAPILTKKEEVWRRRWARAQEVLNSKRIVLRSWRVGEDVMDEAVRLVEREMKRLEAERKG